MPRTPIYIASNLQTFHSTSGKLVRLTIPSSKSLQKYSYQFQQHRCHQIKAQQSRQQSTLNPQILRPLEDITTDKASESKENINVSIATPLTDAAIPSYLHETYWWAYTNPNAVRFWERQWLVDAILWGNFQRLKTEAIAEMDAIFNDSVSCLNITQIACVYGNFSTDLIHKILFKNECKKTTTTELEYRYNIVDIAPIQLLNTKNKICNYLQSETVGKNECSLAVDLYQNNSEKLSDFATNSQQITYLFFLLHEQPKAVRLRTIEEAIRITDDKNGKIVIVDYHKPKARINPFRYIMYPILTYLEPFAMDLWNESVVDYIQEIEQRNEWNISIEKHSFYFGGLYQKLVLVKQSK